MANTTRSRLRGYELNALEISRLTKWTPAMVEDYLNIMDNMFVVATSIDTEVTTRQTIDEESEIFSYFVGTMGV